MKLQFPGGEHAPVVLQEGTILIGSAASCTVVIDGEGVAPHHCEIEVDPGGGGRVRPLGDANVVLNGLRVDGTAALGVGDLLLFGRVGCTVSAGPARPAAPAAEAAAPAAEPEQHTRVRASLPRYVLRGVSGAAHGRTFAVAREMVIGRQEGSDLHLPADEISRRHARIKPAPAGLHVEDLGSSNGTFINGRRIQEGLLAPGDELRLDTVRFLLVAPGMDAQKQSGPAGAAVHPVEPGRRRSPWPWVAAGLVALALLAWLFLKPSVTG